MGSELNPYSAPATVELAEVGKPEIQNPIRFRFALVVSSLLLLGAPAAAFFAHRGIGSIVFSGPIFLCGSLALAALVRPEGLRPFRWIAIPMILMVLGCFLTIFLNSWGPPEAQQPIAWAITVFAAAAQSGWMVIARIRRRWINQSELLSPETSGVDAEATATHQAES